MYETDLFGINHTLTVKSHFMVLDYLCPESFHVIDVWEHGIKALKNTLAHLSELALGGTAVGTGINTPKGYDVVVAKYIAQFTGLPFVTAQNKF